MNRHIKRRWLFIAASGVIILANIVVLGRVFMNRAGEPDSRVELTERELALSHNYRYEDSGTAMKIGWRIFSEQAQGSYGRYYSPSWFGWEKLAELGFDVTSNVRDSAGYVKISRPLPKRVYVVLESNSPLHDKDVALAENRLLEAKNNYLNDMENANLKAAFEHAEDSLQREKIVRSRLYIVDAGIDADKLREKYPDKSKYIISRAVVRMAINYSGDRDTIRGYVEKLDVETIYVPKSMRNVITTPGWKTIRYKSSDSPPSYKAILAFGAGRYEPWLVKVERIQQ